MLKDLSFISKKIISELNNFQDLDLDISNQKTISFLNNLLSDQYNNFLKYKSSIIYKIDINKKKN